MTESFVGSSNGLVTVEPSSVVFFAPSSASFARCIEVVDLGSIAWCDAFLLRFFPQFKTPRDVLMAECIVMNEIL